MSEDKNSKPHEPGSGIRGTRTTGVFRAVNFELFAAPVSSEIICYSKIKVLNHRLLHIITV